MHPAPETGLGDSTAILLHPARGGTTTATAGLAAAGTGVPREGEGWRSHSLLVGLPPPI